MLVVTTFAIDVKSSSFSLAQEHFSQKIFTYLFLNLSTHSWRANRFIDLLVLTICVHCFKKSGECDGQCLNVLSITRGYLTFEFNRNNFKHCGFIMFETIYFSSAYLHPDIYFQKVYTLLTLPR